jgi:hypothetical protein
MTLLKQEHGMFRIEGRSGFSRVPRIPAGEAETFDRLFNTAAVKRYSDSAGKGTKEVRKSALR